MAIKVSEKAVRELKKVIAEKQLPEMVALRIGVTGGGCSGFEYKLDFDENVSDDNDMLSVVDGLRVAVDKKSALYLDGTELDYHESLEKRGFTFNNPNATKSCGCGSSFSA
ncbi:MAG: iron-sulfur cluster assembly accessory protein [Pirellulaceae bacterium]|nr:iron-sulfur cluster assembly accessory protein [Pirellulaceae bacterium]